MHGTTGLTGNTCADLSAQRVMFSPRLMSFYRHAWRSRHLSWQPFRVGLPKPQTCNKCFRNIICVFTWQAIPPSTLAHIFQSCSKCTLSWIDSMQTARNGAAGKLQQLYTTAMQMEVDFFSSRPGTSAPPSIGMLVLDFDDTCTSTDTISQIFNTAIAATQKMAPGRCMAALFASLTCCCEVLLQSFAPHSDTTIQLRSCMLCNVYCVMHVSHCADKAP